MNRHINNIFALLTTGLVRIIAGKEAALRTWNRYKR